MRCTCWWFWNRLPDRRISDGCLVVDFWRFQITRLKPSTLRSKSRQIRNQSVWTASLYGTAFKHFPINWDKLSLGDSIANRLSYQPISVSRTRISRPWRKFAWGRSCNRPEQSWGNSHIIHASFRKTIDSMSKLTSQNSHVVFFPEVHFLC